MCEVWSQNCAFGILTRKVRGVMLLGNQISCTVLNLSLVPEFYMAYTITILYAHNYAQIPYHVCREVNVSRALCIATCSFASSALFVQRQRAARSPACV